MEQRVWADDPRPDDRIRRRQRQLPDEDPAGDDLQHPRQKEVYGRSGTELLQPLLLHHPQSPEPRGHGAENARRQSRRPQGDGIRVRIRPAGGGPVLQHGEGRVLRDGGISRLPGRQGGVQTGHDLLGDRRRRDRRFGERIHPRIQAADKPFGSRVGPLQSPGDG